MDARAFEHQTEHAIAAFARHYVVAANDLNPFVDARVLDLEPAVAVYAGTFSPVHGVIGRASAIQRFRRSWRKLNTFFKKMNEHRFGKPHRRPSPNSWTTFGPMALVFSKSKRCWACS